MAKEKIYAIDDDKDVLAALEEIITLAGYEIHTISDSTIALERILEDPPALIFMDIQMPQINGFQLLQSVRDNEKIADTPVILLSAISAVTGTDYDSEKIEAQYGVWPDAFISKPIKPQIVQEQLKRFLNRRHTDFQCEDGVL